MANAIAKKEQHQMTVIQMIHGFKTQMEMDDADWYRFCLRYSDRNITTVILFFEDMYGKMPYGFNEIFRNEMKARLVTAR